MPGSSAVRSPADLGIGQLFETVRDAVVVADAASGRIVLWNPAAETLFGYSLDEALGMPVEVLIPSELRSRHRNGLARFHETGRGAIVDEGAVVEVPAMRKDGQGLMVELSLNPIAQASVKGRYALAIIRDVTERARLRAQAEEAALLAERYRLARELHDVVAHGISVMVLQAGAARRIVEKDPAEVRTVLATIEESGRLAMTEMRRLLDMLRDDEDENGELEPQPTIERIEPLLARLRATGMRVELRVEGERREVGAGLALSAYRIVQESLTNALKYAPNGRAEVALRYERSALDIEVRNESSKPVTAELTGGGRGLLGMRERAAMFSGAFEAGPVEGGWRVWARLPIEAPE